MNIITINNKTYSIHIFNKIAQKSGNTCPCYECDLKMGSSECDSFDCIKDNFLYLKFIK